MAGSLFGSGDSRRWNGGTVERWNGGTVERWNAVRDGRLGSFLCSVGFAGSCTLSHDVALTVPTAWDKWNHFECSERARTRENSQNQALSFAFVIRGNSREFAAIRVSNCSLCPRRIWFAIAETRMTRMSANVRECPRIKHWNDLTLIVRR